MSNDQLTWIILTYYMTRSEVTEEYVLQTLQDNENYFKCFRGLPNR